jgi:prophage tail gpP-like protein
VSTSHRIDLYLGADRTRLSNWDGYAISLDMFKAGSPWTFGLWHSEAPDSAWAGVLARAQAGAPLVVEIDGAPQLNGRVEERTIRQSRAGAVLTISGRDISGPLIDWDADPRTQLYGRTLEEAFAALAKPLGIRVVITAAASARMIQSRGPVRARGATRQSRRNRVDKSRPRPGERVWQVMESIIRRLGLMMWVAPTANGELGLVVDVPAYDSEVLFRFESRVRNGVTTPESNVLESEYFVSIRDVPTVVYAAGRAPRGDGPSSRHMVGVPNNNFHIGTDFLGTGAGIYADISPETNAALHTPFGALPTFLSYDSAAPPPLSEPGGTPGEAAGASTPDGAATRTTVRRGYQNDALARSPLVVNPLPPQPRYLHTQRAQSPATGQQEAARTAADAMRHWRTYTPTVQGHGQNDRVYAVNCMARVHDTLAQITDEDMLVTRVEFTGSRDAGQKTKVVLGTKGAIQLHEEPGA